MTDEQLEQAGIPKLLAEVLASRGIVSPSQAHALYSAGAASLLDPLGMLGMKEARDRVLLAIERKERVTVYGDYDVDGITSTCLLTDYLRSCGVDCRWYIPDRNDEGYGLNSAALQKLREEGCTLVISVDCGVTATEEAVFARSLGLDLVITDHHECKNGSIPDACAVVDPKRPDDTYANPHLAGVGVAFKLVSACSGDQLAMLERYADLVAVGTVADVMPLTGENRYLVQRGLQKLETAPRPGFYAIMNEPGTLPRKPNAGFIGFTLAPRLNAAGRLGQTEKAEELMLTGDPAEAARTACADEQWAYAAYVLSGLDLSHLPETFADLPELYVSACFHQGMLLWEADQPDAAYPYLQRAADQPGVSRILESSSLWKLLGTWTDDQHTLTFSGDGTCEIDGESAAWELQEYSILINGEERYKISSSIRTTVALRDTAQGKTLTLSRTAPAPLLPLPAVEYVEPAPTATEAPAEAETVPDAQAETEAGETESAPADDASASAPETTPAPEAEAAPAETAPAAEETAAPANP